MIQLVALASVAFALLGVWGGWQRLEAKEAQARVETVTYQRDSALKQAKDSEQELVAQRQRAAATDALLVERDNRIRRLQQSQQIIKGEYENLRKKLEAADIACLTRDMPDALLERLRLGPPDVHKDGKGPSS